MKIIAKTKAVFADNKAETIMEVLVAFLVLTIVMVLFAQGISYANVAEMYALNNGKTSDDSLFELQKTISGNNGSAKIQNETPENFSLEGCSKDIKLRQYCVVAPEGGETNCCFYWVFDVK